VYRQVDEVASKCVIAYLMRQHSQQVQRIGMAWILMQSLLISIVGLLQPPGLMMCQSDLNQLIC
jgi:hypothetical protein